MTFANPDALFWIFLAVPIALLFLLRVRLRRVTVSTSLFWRQVFEHEQSRSLWRSLRYIVSLLAQLLFLALVVLAMAVPTFEWETRESRRLVLVLDNSASMGATDVAPTRLARAREEARRIVGSLRAIDDMAVVVGGTEPQVVCGFTPHKAALRRAIDEVPAGHGPTRVREAVELARRLVAAHANRAIVVLSDGGFAGAEELSKSGDVRWVAVGERSANVGLTAFQARRGLSDPAGYEVYIEAAHHRDGDDSAECRLVVELNGQEIDVIPLSLAPNKVWRHVIPGMSIEGGRLKARIEYDDALAADNEAWAVLPRLEGLPVHLATPGNLFLEKVFQANPLVKLTAGGQTPAPRAVTVYHRKVPATFPAGRAIVIDPETSCDLWRIGPPLVNPVVAREDRDSPLLANVKLDQLHLARAGRLAFADHLKPLAREVAAAETGDSVYAVIDRPQGKVLVLSLSLDEGNLPLRLAFPILMANALSWLGGQGDEAREAVATGAVVEAELPGDGPFLLVAPDGSSRELPPGRRAVLGPLDGVGIWSVVAGGEPVLEVACNLADLRESDLRPPAGPRANQEGLPSAGISRHPPWFYLLLLAVLFTAAEWYLYQRRVLA